MTKNTTEVAGMPDDVELRRAWRAFTVAKQVGSDDFDALKAALSAIKGQLSTVDEVEMQRLKCSEALNALDRIYGVTLNNNSPAGKLLAIESIVASAIRNGDGG